MGNGLNSVLTFDLVTTAWGTSPAAVFSLNSSSLKTAVVFQCQRPITISHVGFGQGVSAGTPPSYKISLYNVNSNGDPDLANIKGGATPATATFTPVTANNSSFQWIALTNSYSATRGEFMALVIEPVGTPDTGNYLQAIYGYGNIEGRANLAYARTYNGTTWAAQSSVARPPYGVKDGVVATNVIGYPTCSYGGLSTSNPTGVETGVRFILPTGVGDTFTLLGITGFFLSYSSSAPININLYSNPTTSPNLIATLLTNFSSGETAILTSGYNTIYFSQSIVLTSGNSYGLVFPSPAFGQGNSLMIFRLTDPNDKVALPLDGHMSYITRSDLGAAFTETATTIPSIQLILDDLENGTVVNTFTSSIIG